MRSALSHDIADTVWHHVEERPPKEMQFLQRSRYISQYKHVENACVQAIQRASHARARQRALRVVEVGLKLVRCCPAVIALTRCRLEDNNERGIRTRNGYVRAVFETLTLERPRSLNKCDESGVEMKTLQSIEPRLSTLARQEDTVAAGAVAAAWVVSWAAAERICPDSRLPRDRGLHVRNLRRVLPIGGSHIASIEVYAWSTCLSSR